jgi:hypothetical protein
LPPLSSFDWNSLAYPLIITTWLEGKVFSLFMKTTSAATVEREASTTLARYTYLAGGMTSAPGGGIDRCM